MSDFTFTVAGDPPVINHSYKIVYVGERCPCCGRGKSRIAKADNVETWQQAVAWSAKAARPSGWVPARRTRIEVEWYTVRPHDADAGLKALADGIAVGLGCDDKGFLTTVISNETDKAAPRTVVRVTNEAP